MFLLRFLQERGLRAQEETPLAVLAGGWKAEELSSLWWIERLAGAPPGRQGFLQLLPSPPLRSPSPPWA